MVREDLEKEDGRYLVHYRFETSEEAR